MTNIVAEAEAILKQRDSSGVVLERRLKVIDGIINRLAELKVQLIKQWEARQ